MDSTFWVGIAIGAILSLLASIVANIYNDRIQNSIDVLKLSRIGKRRSKELNEYRRIARIRENWPDKSAYLIILSNRASTLNHAATYMGILAVLSLICFVSDLPEIFYFPLGKGIFGQYEKSIWLTLSFICMFSFLVFIGLVITLSRRFIATATRLNNFTRYEGELRKRWNYTDEELNNREAPRDPTVSTFPPQQLPLRAD